MRPDFFIQSVSAAAYTIPTDLPEADGTAARDSTAIVLVHVEGGGRSAPDRDRPGLGLTFRPDAAAPYAVKAQA